MRLTSRRPIITFRLDRPATQELPQAEDQIAGAVRISWA